MSLKTTLFGKKGPAPAAEAPQVDPTAPKKKKLGKGLIVPAMVIFCGAILVSQIAKQGGSLEDQRLIDEQRKKAEEALRKGYETGVDDPLAQAAAELRNAREKAEKDRPQPGAAVSLPDDADAILENKRRELDQAWEDIKKKRGPSEKDATAARKGGGEAKPGFVGYVVESGSKRDGVLQAQGLTAQPPSAATADRANPTGDMIAQRARYERELRDLEVESAKRAARNGNTNWRDDRSSDASPEKVKVATQIQGRNVLFAGTVINAVIEQAIDTALPGRLRARVTTDIYDSKTGQTVVVGRGSTLTGQYRSEITEGQERVFAVFDRLITPYGAVVALGQIEASDQMATTGIPGELHTHFWHRMGIATLMAIQSAVVEKKVGSVGQVAGAGGQATSSAAGQILLKTTEKELERRYDVPSNITVPAGALLTLVIQDNVEIPSNSGKR